MNFSSRQSATSTSQDFTKNINYGTNEIAFTNYFLLKIQKLNFEKASAR